MQITLENIFIFKRKMQKKYDNCFKTIFFVGLNVLLIKTKTQGLFQFGGVLNYKVVKLKKLFSS